MLIYSAKIIYSVAFIANSDFPVKFPRIRFRFIFCQVGVFLRFGPAGSFKGMACGKFVSL